MPYQAISKLLPRDARDALVLASRVPDERDRRLAVDAAIDRVKSRYPQFFKQEEPKNESQDQ